MCAKYEDIEIIKSDFLNVFISVQSLLVSLKMNLLASLAAQTEKMISFLKSFF